MTDYVVGDIQACYSGLRRLLDKINFDPANDKLWAAGDLIGRGPEAEQTLAFFLSLGESAESVLGNHDLHFLAIAHGVKADNPKNRFTQLLNSRRLPEYIDWLQRRPLACMPDEQTLLCHAGLYPQWSFKQALGYAAEIEAILRSDGFVALLSTMYGAQPNKWSDGLVGENRQRFIINAFTRMRFLQTNDQLEFKCKVSPESAPACLTPWFEVKNSNVTEGQKVVFGHWATLDGKTNTDRKIGLDTGYIWGGALTCFDLQKARIYSILAED